MKLALLSLIFGLASQSTFAAVADLDLEKKLALGNTAHAIIELAPIPEDLFSAIEANSTLSKDQRWQLVWDLVGQFTSSSQAPVTQLLGSLGLPFTSFSTANIILVPNITPLTLSLLKDSGLDFNIREQETLAVQPQGSIQKDSISLLAEEIPQEKVGASSLCLFKRPPSCPTTSSATNPSWNIRLTGADVVWNLPDGNQGEGIIVANIDTGVAPCHYALWDRFTGIFGVATTGLGIVIPTPIPSDDNDHGTATMSNIAGGCGLGMAPKARWTGCKGLNSQGSGYEADLIACFDFLLGLPSEHRPDIISNSWGGGKGSTSYDQVLTTATAMRISTVFAAGNGGPNCNTTISPGDNRFTKSVGAIARDKSLAQFSARGPGISRIKPDLVAPGVNVLLATATGYGSGSGTSFSAPHLAGALALIRSKKPTWSPSQAFNLLGNWAEMPSFNGGCGQDPGIFPNNLWGRGILDVETAFRVA